MKIRVMLTLTALTLALSTVAFAQNSKLSLNPSGFGAHSYVAWKAQQGLPDSNGNGNHALYFQKDTTTGTFAAGVAVVKGVGGLNASQLTGLSWEHRDDGHCGAGAPRWNVNTESANGTPHTYFIGCAAMAHTPGSAPGWTRDTAALPIFASDETITSLVIVFDEGNDTPGVTPFSFIFLDNITVELNGMPKVFTGPMDNSNK